MKLKSLNTIKFEEINNTDMKNLTGGTENEMVLTWIPLDTPLVGGGMFIWDTVAHKADSAVGNQN